MPQLHLYLNKHKAEEIRRRAAAEGLSVSRYLARLVDSALGSDWPEGYFETVVGGWQGKPLERPDQGEFDERDGFVVSP